MWAYGIGKQLFARRPLGKIWAGRAALENATGVEGCGKKFGKAVAPTVAIFQNFPYMENWNFAYMSQVAIIAPGCSGYDSFYFLP